MFFNFSHFLLTPTFVVYAFATAYNELAVTFKMLVRPLVYRA